MPALPWRLVVSMAVGVLCMSACDSDDTGGDGSTTTSATRVPVTGAGATSSAATAASTAPTGPSTTPGSAGTASGAAAQCDVRGRPQVFAYERTTGDLRWTVCGTGVRVTTLAGATDDTVYAVSSDPSTRLVALDAASGAPRWQLDLAPGASPAPGPLIGEGVIVVTIGDDRQPSLAGVDPATGSVVWQVPVSAPPLAATEGDVVVYDTAAPAPSGAAGRPTARVPVSLIGYDRATGEKEWSATVDVGTNVMAPSASVDGGTVFIPHGPSAVDATNGSTSVDDGRFDGQRFARPGVRRCPPHRRR